MRFAWVAVFLLGCRSNKSMFEDDASTSPDASMPDLDATLTNDGTMGDAGCTTNQCSADLHTILDCNGNKVMDCPMGQACGNGMCMAPCDAAKANKSSLG